MKGVNRTSYARKTVEKARETKKKTWMQQISKDGNYSFRNLTLHSVRTKEQRERKNQ